MKNCMNCKYSRQRCKMSDQDIVGCSMVCPHEVQHGKVSLVGKGEAYTGWFYNNRRVGDTSERNDIGSGAMVNGLLIEYTQCCTKWEERL